MKIKSLVLSMTVATGLSFSSASMANVDVDNAAQKLNNAWTQCGIGAMIFKELPVAAAISNIIWDWGTTAVLSMVASPETCKGVNVAAASFINESVDQLESDIAKGNGRHMVAMLALMGCEQDAHSATITGIRQQLANDDSFAELTHTEKAQAIYLATEKQINSNCTVS